MPTPTISVRSAGPDDINALVDLLRQLFAIEKDFKFDEEKHKKGLLMMFDGCGKHKTVKVAVIDRTIVGMCAMQTRISTATGTVSGVIEDLVVDEAFRGEKVGQTLLLHMEQWARMRGIKNIQLLADKKNSDALEFYARQNWKNTRLICLTRSL